jgi:hypothetical protein
MKVRAYVVNTVLVRTITNMVRAQVVSLLQCPRSAMHQYVCFSRPIEVYEGLLLLVLHSIPTLLV